MSKSIIINLQESDQAKEYKDENLIHAKEFEIISTYLQELKVLAETYPDKDNLHNAITVWGTRGSGKTSFLLSTHDYVKNNLKVIEVLDIIDPTLIEEKGHVFLNVISAISARVEYKLQEKECQPTSASLNFRKKWREKLLKLAAGIPTIDGVGSVNMESWQDPEFIMDSGLTAVKAARDLKKNFNSTLEFALEVLNKKAFVITFDDIDVDSTKGWAILECIRKYFTSSKLIVIVSGDPNLYLSVIRHKKWTNFGADLLKYEGTHWKHQDGTNERLSSFNDLVTDLTAQYMLKIMPPKYRIHLTTLQEKVITGVNPSITIKYKNEERYLELLYNEILGRFGFYNELQMEVYRTFLMSLPLRTQIQFLLTMGIPESPSKTKKETTKIVDSNPPDNHNKAEESEKVKSNITDVFLADLQEKKVDTLVAGKIPKFLNIIILKLLVKERRLSDLYQLQPVTTDNSLNASLFSLNLELADMISRQQSFLVFDYFMRVALIRNIVDNIPYEQKSKGDRNDLYSPTIDDLCAKTGLYNDVVLRDAIASVQGYICGALNLNSERYNNYFIRLNGLKGKAKRPLDDRLDSVFMEPGVSEAQITLGHLPGFSLYSKNTSIVCYSVYVLIAAIGEIVKRDEMITRDRSEVNRKNEIRTALSSLSQLRSYPIIEFANTVIQSKQIRPKRDDDFEEEEMEIDTSSEDTSSTDAPPISNIEKEENADDKQENSDPKSPADPQKQLIEWVYNWLNADIKLKLVVAPHLLGKIFTRFHFAIKNIIDQRPNLGLGDLVHFQVITFFNSVLIEECLELLNNSPKLNLNNTNTSIEILRTNLNKLNNRPNIEEKELPLSKWLLCCPLLIPYLDNNEDILKDALEKFTDSKLQVYLNISVKTLLNKVSIWGREQKGENTTSSSEYQVYPESASNKLLTRKGNEHELIKVLVENGYPKEWFITTDSTTDFRNNKEIRKYLFSIFGSKAGLIRNFRRYLTQNQDLWK